MILFQKILKTDKFVIVSYLLVVFAGNINAQDFQLAGTHFLTYPSSGVKDSPKEIGFSFKEYGAFINLPFMLKNKKTAFIGGAGYGTVKVTGENLPMNGYNQLEEQLHAVYLQLGMAHKLRNNWRFTTIMRPTIASDFENKRSSGDFLPQGTAFAVKSINDHFSMGGGLAYTSRFGKPIAIPVLPLKYKIHRHNISMLFPIRSGYSYSFGKNENLKIGFKQTVNGGQFNLTTSIPSEYDASQINKVRYTRINLGGNINYQLGKFIQLEMHGGTTVRRKYTILDISNETHQFDLDKSLFLRFGILIVPPILHQ